MSTILHASPVFGPIHSRRLGISLGINLLPASGKVCTFDCIYCECGLNAQRRTVEKMPTATVVIDRLEQALQKMAQDEQLPDVITFAGNGEPTAHPQFAQIVQQTLQLRQIWAPKAKIAVLSNGSQIHKPAVFDALMQVDDNILKLDTVNQAYIDRVDRPCGHYLINEQIRYLCRFNGHVMIQTLFMSGTDARGIDVDNTSDAFVTPWLQALQEIAPEKVMIYTIDRETPISSLKKASKITLDEIAERVKALGLNVSVSY